MKFDKALFKRLVGEFSGTAMLMCAGCMGVVGCDTMPRNLFMITVSFSFIVGACIQTFACVSGAHINPSVTIANCLLGLKPWYEAIAYVFMQFLGAGFGYSLLCLCLPRSLIYMEHGLCTTHVNKSISVGQGVGIEFVLTASLIYFCCGVWDERNAGLFDTVSLRFALHIACLLLSGGHYTGASMNFARSLAPAIWHSEYGDLWVYPVGQIPAACLIPFAWKFLHTPKSSSSDKTEGPA